MGSYTVTVTLRSFQDVAMAQHSCPKNVTSSFQSMDSSTRPTNASHSENRDAPNLNCISPPQLRPAESVRLGPWGQHSGSRRRGPQASLSSVRKGAGSRRISQYRPQAWRKCCSRGHRPAPSLIRLAPARTAPSWNNQEHSTPRGVEDSNSKQIRRMPAPGRNARR